MNNQVSTKVCSKCQDDKPVVKFCKHRRSKDGLSNECKDCAKKRNSKYYLKNKKDLNLKSKHYQIEKKDEIKLRKHQNYLKHKNENLLYAKQRRLKHKEENKLYHKQYSSIIENKEKINNRTRKWRKQRRSENLINPTVRLIDNTRARNRQAFKSQGVVKPMHTIEGLGCTALEFQAHMISNFKPGMTKENNGKRKWVQHHVIPFSSVDLSDIEQLKKVCHYTNIIPMWEDEHIEWHRTHPQ
jgi:hypothetical protein